ncbi:DUF5895 domain-containing protein [Microcoleus sp. A006_D1]|uniref:DUF5895 domain-containing protein n=1 Tax=Microcoleus sp. A006_D1 TaxID=3055267 RepID=UPI002FD33340
MTKKSVSSDAVESTTSTESIASEFQFDPSLMGEEFNAVRIPRLPYGIVINDNPCGIFIPEKNAIKAGWTNLEGLTEIDLASGAKEKGLFFSTIRMAILGNVAPYIRYKNAEQNGDLAGTVVGSYEFDRTLLDKKTMEVVSEHLVMFVDESNNLLHTRPIRIRFKNVALWCLRESLEEFYTAIELVFAKLTQGKASGKNDKWRSLCVFCATFKAVKEGEGSNRSYCMKVESWVMPSIDNFGSMFLGMKAQKDAIWESYDMNIGSLEAKALSGSSQALLRSAD